jgi:uncharacterized membrane protein YecN with MAPEG domain
MPLFFCWFALSLGVFKVGFLPLQQLLFGRCYMGWAAGVLHSAVMFWRCGFVRHWAALYCLYLGVLYYVFSERKKKHKVQYLNIV